MDISRTVTVGGKWISRPPAESSQFSFEHTLQKKNNVCQKAFCTVHGLGSSVTVQRETGELEPDKWGKHPSNSEDVKERV